MRHDCGRVSRRPPSNRRMETHETGSADGVGIPESRQPPIPAGFRVRTRVQAATPMSTCLSAHEEFADLAATGRGCGRVGRGHAVPRYLRYRCGRRPGISGVDDESLTVAARARRPPSPRRAARRRRPGRCRSRSPRAARPTGAPAPRPGRLALGRHGLCRPSARR